jgi:ubiquitin C
MRCLTDLPRGPAPRCGYGRDDGFTHATQAMHDRRDVIKRRLEDGLVAYCSDPAWFGWRPEAARLVVWGLADFLAARAWSIECTKGDWKRMQLWPSPAIDKVWCIMGTMTQPPLKFRHPILALPVAAAAGQYQDVYQVTCFIVGLRLDRPGALNGVAWPDQPACDTQVFVKGLAGTMRTFDLSLDWPALWLKWGIAWTERVNVDGQRLIFAGRQLVDGKTLAEQGVCKEATVHLILSMRGD